MRLRRPAVPPPGSSNRPLSEGQPNKHLPRGCAVLFFSIFLLAGLGVSYPVLVKPLADSLAARSWLELSAEILESEVRASSDGDTYRVGVKYRYTYRGREYISESYDFQEISSSGYESKAEVVRGLAPGRRVVCYVDPGNPSRAVLKRDLGWGLLFGLLPLVFVAVGAGGIYFTLRSKPAGGPNPLLDGGPGRWFPGAVSREPSLRLPGGELTPRTSRGAKLVGLILVTLFWNGLISFFVLHVIAEWRRGDSSWFLSVFLLPFVLIGLALIGGVIHSFLGLFNPCVRLIASDRDVALGQTLDLSWSIEGKTDRLRNFRIVLEGTEHATFRRGTDTKTDTEVFYTTVLSETMGGPSLARGSVRVVIPRNSMHTFKSRNNEIRWTLRVKAEIPRWPDINEEYAITVHPQEPETGHSS